MLMMPSELVTGTILMGTDCELSDVEGEGTGPHHVMEALTTTEAGVEEVVVAGIPTCPGDLNTE